MARPVDRPFLILAVILVLFGIFIFSSASLGLLAREGAALSRIITNQAFSLLIGFILMFLASRVSYQFWNKIALHLFIFSLGLTALVFVPGLGFSHGGATRWLALGPITFQPAELLKLAFVVYFAAWLSGAWKRLGDMRFGILPLVILLALIGGVLALQPDMGTFVVVAVTGFAMFLAGGGRWTHAFLLLVVGVLALGALGLAVPYINTRLTTFLNPAQDPLGAGYQIQQSLIAVGSGGIVGRGFGQSVQKFNFLPEPVSDSIFAVFAEEWGFVGAVVLIALFVLFALRGFKIASRSPSIFSGLLVTGIILLIAVQALLNIASMLSLFPLTGMPLLFVSQGGSAIIVTLLEVGIVLSVSRNQKIA